MGCVQPYMHLHGLVDLPSPCNIYGTLGFAVLRPSNSPHPGPSLTNLESWRRELHFGVKHAHIELFLGSISMKIDYNLGTHDDHDGGARAPPRARVARAGRPAVLTPRAPLRPEPSRRLLRANLGYWWAYSSSALRLYNFQIAKPSRKWRTDVAKTRVLQDAHVRWLPVSSVTYALLCHHQPKFASPSPSSQRHRS